MRINKINSIAEIYKTQSMVSVQKSKPGQKDEVIFSAKALGIQNAYKAAKASSDVRVDKVEELKEQIKTGNYNVNAKELSGKIVSQLDIRG